MERRDHVVNWVAAAGLTFAAIILQDRLQRANDFSSARKKDYLGDWKTRQGVLSDILSKVPIGPQIVVKLSSGFCGHNELRLSRLPVVSSGKASWGSALGIFHEPNASPKINDGMLISEASEWTDIPTAPLSHQKGHIGVVISRTTLMNMIILTNGRSIWEYADASGFRGAYASMCGQWYVNWKIGGPAVATFKAHDSHSAATDVYPPSWPIRVDRCIQMMAGVVVKASAPKDFSIGFPGRMPPGRYQLELQIKGFAGSHGSRHIYNMNGGEVYNVDFLFIRKADAADTSIPEPARILAVPSVDGNDETEILVPEEEQMILAKAMDYLPYAWLSWSIHRGLRDILMAYSKPVMDTYRTKLAKELRKIVKDYRSQLIANGWEAGFVDERMGDLAASSVLAGRGNSGDMVRIVSDLGELQWAGRRDEMDETTFWQEETRNAPKREKLDPQVIVALVKCFILEWSVDFDYQMYHQLPIDLLME
jgi:hypothetical protein